jgi:hypothetical protein
MHIINGHISGISSILDYSKIPLAEVKESRGPKT